MFRVMKTVTMSLRMIVLVVTVIKVELIMLLMQMIPHIVRVGTDTALFCVKVTHNLDGIIS